METLKEKYGEDYFEKMGRKGGKKTPPESRGFSNPEVARKAGKKSRRKPLQGRVIKCCALPSFLIINPAVCANCGKERE